MIRRILNRRRLRRKQRECEHPEGARGKREQTVLGATASWGGNIVVMFQFTSRCEECGEVITKKGYLLRAVERTPLDEKGWPLDKDGVRMGIYDPDIERGEVSDDDQDMD